MTINRAMQLEEVNNELIQVLLGLTARVRTAVKMLKECDHDHTTVTTTLLSTFQAEGLLRKVAPTAEGVALEAFANMAQSELQGEVEAAEPFLMRYAEPVDQSQADYVRERLQGTPPCTNPSCVDGLAPRKTGPDDGDVDMEPCPACGGPNAN